MNDLNALLDALTVTRADIAAALGTTPTTVSHKRAGRGRYDWTEADEAALVELARQRVALIEAAIAEVTGDDADGG